MKGMEGKKYIAHMSENRFFLLYGIKIFAFAKHKCFLVSIISQSRMKFTDVVVKKCINFDKLMRL